MKLLKKNLIENLSIALTLNPINEVYLLNHQDCGAIKEFLACSGYPQTLGENNLKEIKINSTLLVYANEYMLKQFPKMKYVLGFVDINGSVATYNAEKNVWTVIFVGKYHDKKGTWYNMKVGSTLKL
jgi:carbonic anhydrase